VAARSSDQIEEVALEIEAYPVVADVSQRDSVESLVRAVESELGPIDILCANAGVSSRDERAWESDPGEWWRTFEVNVLGVYLCCRAVIPGCSRAAAGASSSPAAAPPTSRLVELRLLGVEGRGVAVRRGARASARRADPGVHLLAGPRAHADDVMGADDAPWTPAHLAPRLVRVLASAGPTPSRAGTSTRSTTTSSS
jgi:NAD(P)-dependent dehydrogenase (short-subunit alcohol dehydrogenase family)